MKRNKAMTLMEIIIVIVLIGILSSAGVVGYRQTVLNARNREAQAMLRLITHAEDVWRVEMNDLLPAEIPLTVTPLTPEFA
jgi:prepilin-type N-terminal cleavage/methylation domain-containing protein